MSGDMAATDLCSKTISEWSHLIREKEISPVDLVQAIIDRIEALDPRLHTYITFRPEQALKEARDAERDITLGRYRGPLHGIPMALKDLYDSAGLRTTYGSKIFEDHLPQQDATTLARLKEVGAVQLGKLNLHEFAYGPTSINPHYDTARNPWNLSCIPGGSSGGSGSAVGAGLVGFSLGTDTGGSVRIPASLCGIVGLKPTYGRVSRYGIFPLSWALDHVGVMTRSVEDAALVLQVIAGQDPKDPTTVDQPVPDYRTASLSIDIRGLRIGIPTSFFCDLVEPEVSQAVQLAIDALKELGVETIPVSLPLWDHAPTASSLILGSEATSVHRKWLKTHRDLYDPVVRERLLIGFFITAEQYLLAQRMRSLLCHQMHQLMQQVELIAMPTTPISAVPIEQTTYLLNGSEHQVVSLLTRHTRLANLTGQPAASIPCGFTKTNLPIGLQLIGRPFEETIVLKAASAYESATDWHIRRPKMVRGSGRQLS